MNNVLAVINVSMALRLLDFQLKKNDFCRLDQIVFLYSRLTLARLKYCPGLVLQFTAAASSPFRLLSVMMAASCVY